MHAIEPVHQNEEALVSPIVQFVFFHKAIGAELERLRQDALAVEKGSEREVDALRDRYLFLRAVYKHHSSAEDERIAINILKGLRERKLERLLLSFFFVEHEVPVRALQFNSGVQIVDHFLSGTCIRSHYCMGPGKSSLQKCLMKVLLPALDLRVKNVAHAYSLEHKVESDLFDQMSGLLRKALNEKGNVPSTLRRELICCTEALQTTLCQHLSKEEEQVFPLLMEHFDFEEQAALVWQFMCSIPVNLMEKFLPWLISSLSPDEQQVMLACLRDIVPREELLQQVVSAWLRGGSIALESKNIFEAEAIIDKSLEEYQDKNLRLRKGHMELVQEGIIGKSAAVWSPINELLYWHNAIRKELREFIEEARRIQLLGDMSHPNLSSFIERLRFLAEVCTFHSAAEDKVVFPAVNRKVKQRVSYTTDHADEERKFDDVRRLLEGVQAAVNSNSTAAELYGELCVQAEVIVETIQQHLLDEEDQVLPLARKHCSIEEQRDLLYQSLCVMPLKLLERVLPWLAAVLSEDEAKDMLHNMRLAAPVADNALVTLFSGWACKGHALNGTDPGKYRCISSTSVNECSMIFPKTLWETDTEPDDENISCVSGQALSVEVGGRHSPEVPLEKFDNRPLKRMRTESPKDEQEGGEGLQRCGAGGACCVPGLGCQSIGARASGPSLRSYPVGLVSPLVSSSFGSGFFSWGSSIGTLGAGPSPKPIDHIFQFHKAIRKDLEYLDVESGRLADCDDEFLRQFSGRFQFLWGLYRAHSNAEDEIVFPALEAKEALHNVSHSYTIDHKQEEQLFKDIAQELLELSHLHSHRSSLCSSVVTDGESSTEVQSGSEDTAQRDLAAKLQGMCKSVRVSLDQHVSREELELWPLFDVHFTIEEQDQIVGRIIGTTGAEVLQAMLPWVTTALTEEEQNTMMDTWRQATRNTMFDKWLSAWWKDTPLSTAESPKETENNVIPPSGTSESLQMVADYFASGASTGEQNAKGTSRDVDSEDTPGVTGVLQVAQESRKEEEEAQPETNSGAGGAASSSYNEKQEGGGLINDAVQKGRGQVGMEREKFKPGWRDIFRMNQKELEAAIRKVSSDSSLDPRRKAYLMQNLMTSRWIATQQQFSHTQALQPSDGPVDIPGRSRSYHDEARGIYGCEHYRRNCKLRASCCGNIYPCRFCHDKVSDHSMDRHATKEMVCMKCLEVQPVAATCSTPACDGFSMARYFCNICKFFDNDDRDIYHCPFCNLCRVGKGLGVDYFHCMTCNQCMSTKLSSHKCREKGLESNCPICHDFLFTSNTPVKALPCGHFMHSACFQAYTCSHYTCPICSKSLGDMAVYFGMLDALLASEQLPDEFQNRQQDILCNDCEQKGSSRFHWLYHKCAKCGSYNTRAI